MCVCVGGGGGADGNNYFVLETGLINEGVAI